MSRLVVLYIGCVPCRCRSFAGGGSTGHAVHCGIYDLEKRIAFLEADPEIDDLIITGARADIRRLNATLHPPRWRWAVPCCYSRKPIHIR
jgi:hypothetical protein